MKVAHILTSTKKRCFLALLFVLLASFTMKVGYVVVVKVGYLHASSANWDAWKDPGASDFKQSYVPASEAIMSGYIFDNKNISPKASEKLAKFPGFPSFIALVRSIAGDNIAILRLSCIFLYSLSSALTCFLAYRAFGKDVAFLTAPFAILSPLMTFWSFYILTESLFTLLLLISITVLIHVAKFEKTNWLVPALGGIAFGYASWTRQVLIFSIVLIPLWYVLNALFHKPKTMIPAKALIIFVIFAMAIYFGWAARNVILTGNSYMPIKSGINELKKPFKGVVNLWKINTPHNTVLNNKPNEQLEKTSNINKSLKFFQKILISPFTAYWHLGLASSHQTFWNSNIIRFFVIFYLFSFSLMLISLRYLLRDFMPLSLLWLLIVYFTLVHVIVAGWSNVSRYRVPIEPYIYILAAYGLYKVYSAIKLKYSKA